MLDPGRLLLAREVRVGWQLEAVRGVLLREEEQLLGARAAYTKRKAYTFETGSRISRVAPLAPRRAARGPGLCAGRGGALTPAYFNRIMDRILTIVPFRSPSAILVPRELRASHQPLRGGRRVTSRPRHARHQPSVPCRSVERAPGIFEEDAARCTLPKPRSRRRSGGSPAQRDVSNALSMRTRRGWG